MPLAVFTSPGPLLFQLGPFSLRWYGLLIAGSALGTLVGVAWAAGPDRVFDRITHVDPVWFAVAFGAVSGCRSAGSSSCACGR